jgi:YD repeat-containing protein
MPYVSYLILAAQRLAIDPNAMLMYYENNGIVYATTPDGVQHTFTYAELDRPSAKKTDPGSSQGSISVAKHSPAPIGPPVKRRRK